MPRAQQEKLKEIDFSSFVKYSISLANQHKANYFCGKKIRNEIN